MRETGAELAGEMSGHFFFAERWYGFDDGIYAAARLLEIIDGSAHSASELLEALVEGVSTPEIKVSAPDGDPQAFVERFRANARFEGARSVSYTHLDVYKRQGFFGLLEVGFNHSTTLGAPAHLAGCLRHAHPLLCPRFPASRTRSGRHECASCAARR